ncbi:MAG: cob(I)yrinic acid a,c-diamide adenosyltransferase [candidate division WOR-3 bacterium]
MIQLYTGDGKGKTTAALGLALRAAGHCLKTIIIQFLKSENCGYGEHNSIRLLYPYVEIFSFGRECFVERNNPTNTDKEFAIEGYNFFKESLIENKYRIYILDEICVALDYGLIPLDDFVSLVDKLDKNDIEIVLTGRYAPKKLYEIADLVTEFKEIKHYFNESGIMGRKGIDW